MGLFLLCKLNVRVSLVFVCFGVALVGTDTREGDGGKGCGKREGDRRHSVEGE